MILRSSGIFNKGMQKFIEGTISFSGPLFFCFVVFVLLLLLYFTTAPNKQNSAPLCETEEIMMGVITKVRPQMGPLEINFWLKAITVAAREHGVDPIIFTSLVAQESKFNGHSVSLKKAVGASQIMPRWRDSSNSPAVCKKINLNEIEANLSCGAAILAYERGLSPDLATALRKYVAGPAGEQGASWYADQILDRVGNAVYHCSVSHKIV